MIRDLTGDFLPEGNLSIPVKVFHEFFQPVDEFQEGSIVFLLDPKGMKQDDLVFLLEYDARFVFFSSESKAISYESHPVRLLLNDKNANSHLERIRGLKKNIVEMTTVKHHRWDVLGITTSYRQLFNIRDTGYCFVEYPVITENTFSLDDVFIQEALRSTSPEVIISKYLQIVEDMDTSRLEQINRRNAIQKVFSFYRADGAGYRFSLDPQDVEFLVDVLKLERLSDKPLYRAEIIGALTSACAYFIHAGHPESYQIVLNRLMDAAAPEDGGAVRYKYVSEKDLQQMKDGNTFLYYHLTCRIPNQYSVALLDMYLTETDPAKKAEIGNEIEKWAEYLKRRILELSVAPASLLWEFKRDQEIGAMSGTVGLLTLYKRGCMENDPSACHEALNFFNKAVEYAHPDERNRDINYFVQCRLTEIVNSLSLPGSSGEAFRSEIDELAGLFAGRFADREEINVFDVMFSINIVILGYVLEGEERALEIYRRIGLDWSCLGNLLEKNSHQYVTYLASGYLLMAPGVLLENIDTDTLTKRAAEFFGLGNGAHEAKGIMDLIALKYIISRSCCLSSLEGDESRKEIEHYKKIISGSPLYSRWSDSCEGFLDDCLKHSASGKKALQLIYMIPY